MSRKISKEERKRYGCTWCIDKTHGRCPYEKCRYRRIFSGSESYEEWFKNGLDLKKVLLGGKK